MGDRDQLARDLIGCFPVLDKSDRTDAEATDGSRTATVKLREAARLMRERATAATPGPWAAHADGLVWARRIGDPVSGSTEVEDARHIAGWHPAVALTVAGWLESVAIDDEWEPETAPRIRERTAALAVARAYLGEEADRG